MNKNKRKGKKTEELLQLIIDNPGCSVTEIINQNGLKYGSTRSILFDLNRDGLVRAVKRGYYEAVDPNTPAAIQCLGEVTVDIYNLIKNSNEGVAVSQLSRITKTTIPSVIHHIRALAKVGMIEYKGGRGELVRASQGKELTATSQTQQEVVKAEETRIQETASTETRTTAQMILDTERKLQELIELTKMEKKSPTLTQEEFNKWVDLGNRVNLRKESGHDRALDMLFHVVGGERYRELDKSSIQVDLFFDSMNSAAMSETPEAPVYSKEADNLVEKLRGALMDAFEVIESAKDLLSKIQEKGTASMRVMSTTSTPTRRRVWICGVNKHQVQEIYKNHESSKLHIDRVIIRGDEPRSIPAAVDTLVLVTEGIGHRTKDKVVSCKTQNQTLKFVKNYSELKTYLERLAM